MFELPLLRRKTTETTDWCRIKVFGGTHTERNSSTNFIRTLSICAKSDSRMHKKQESWQTGEFSNGRKHRISWRKDSRKWLDWPLLQKGRQLPQIGRTSWRDCQENVPALILRIRLREVYTQGHFIAINKKTVKLKEKPIKSARGSLELIQVFSNPLDPKSNCRRVRPIKLRAATVKTGKRETERLRKYGRIKFKRIWR